MTRPTLPSSGAPDDFSENDGNGRRRGPRPPDDDFYVEATSRTGACGEGRAVGVGDDADDGQAKPVSSAVPDPLCAELPERLEQVPHFARRDERAGVADSQDSAPGGQGCRDLYLAAGQVVPDGVVDEVGRQAFCQARVACRRGCGERDDEADAAAPGFGLAGGARCG